MLLLNVASQVAYAQSDKGKKKSELSEKDRRKHDRLFVDANKAKILQDLEQAVALFEQCLKLDKNNSATYYELANLYIQLSDKDQALTMAEQAVKLEKDNYWYQILYAEALRVHRRYDDAAEVYEGLVDVYPSKVDLYHDLALLYVLSEQLDKAIGCYDKMEEHVGINEQLSIQKQLLYIRMGRIDEATAEIERLIEAFPDEPDNYLLLAEVYLANDMEDKALKVYKRVAEQFPDNAEIHLSLAKMYVDKGDQKKAAEEFKKAFASPDVDIDIKVQVLLGYYGQIQQDKSYMKDALELADILVETHPKEARAHTIQGDLLNSDEQSEAAREAFSKAIALDQSRFAIWSQLILLDAQLGHYDSVIAHSSSAMELFPNQPTPYYFRGIAYMQEDAHDKAVKDLNSGVMLVVDNPMLEAQFYLSMAESYHELDDHASSDASFEKALKIDPNNTVALNNYGYYLSLRAENLEKAESMSAKAIRLEPKQATYLDTYAWILYKMERYEEAREWMEKALKEGGDDSDVLLEHMGDILYRLDRKEEALNYWEKARTKGKGTEFLDRKIQEKTLYE